MLVLTTMFINVSNNLPKTSYMKMVDVWLLFNLLYPFTVVLIHTYMDTLRNDEDREINHHGKTVTVNGETEEDDKNPSIIQVLTANFYLLDQSQVILEILIFLSGGTIDNVVLLPLGLFFAYYGSVHLWFSFVFNE